MNPSSSGWIKKFGHSVQNESRGYDDFESLYENLRQYGFVYGIHLYHPSFIDTELNLTEDEVAKINLLTALYFVYKFEMGKTDFDLFVEELFSFYKELDLGKISLLNKILSGKKTEAQLEKLIDSRIYLGDNLFSRALGNSLTNSLLFIDVLIFKNYLKEGFYVLDHARILEFVTINIAYHALNSKETTQIDDKLIQILDASLTYIDLNKAQFDGSYRKLLKSHFSDFERTYLLDVACLTVWEDQSLEYLESEFIYSIGIDLGKTKNEVKNALETVKAFFEVNFGKIPYLKEQNLAAQYYDGMSKNVGKLILRNSKRLKKELSESKELMLLLSKSATKELTPEERKKMQNQLLDIFKSIPSLAIFMLPGGALLLPIFVKLIPTLLPSAFDDNRVEKNN